MVIDRLQLRQDPRQNVLHPLCGRAQKSGKLVKHRRIVCQQLIKPPAVLLLDHQAVQLFGKRRDRLPRLRRIEADAAGIDVPQEIGAVQPLLGGLPGALQRLLQIGRADIEEAEDHQLGKAGILPLALRLPLAEERLQSRAVLQSGAGCLCHLRGKRAALLDLLPLRAGELGTEFLEQIPLAPLDGQAVYMLIQGLYGLIQHYRGA